MGITGLLQFLKDASEPVNVSKYRGQTVAVDTYCWLHKGAFSCAEKLAKGEPTDQYVWYCMKLVDMLLNLGVRPVLVFDGRNLPSKREVDRSRRERRELNLQKGKQLLRDGKVSEARDCFNRCINITPAMAHDVIKAARARGVDCVVAPYEADAQLAFLSKNGLAEAVITEDSDLLAFGCKKVLLKMDKLGNGLEINQDHLGRVRSLGNVFTEEKFRHMCILSGCDYLPSLHGIGLGKACKLLRLAKDPDVLKVIKRMGQYLKMDLSVPDSYVEGFVQADNTFLYQLVFDPRSRRVVPLNPYPESVSPQELSYAGLNLGDEKGLQMALGNLDINTLEQIDNFCPDASRPQAWKLRSRSWNDSPSSLSCKGPSIWSRGAAAAPPTAPASASPVAEPRASTRGQNSVVSVAPLHLPSQELQVKRPREDSPLSDRDMFLLYSPSELKRPRPATPPLAGAPFRSRNRFATLLQRRNQDMEDGTGTSSRFFSSSSDPRTSQTSGTSAPPPWGQGSEAGDSNSPEAPSVDTPSSSPSAETPPPSQSPVETPPPPQSPAEATAPIRSRCGLRHFLWSDGASGQSLLAQTISSSSSISSSSAGLLTLKRFRFKQNLQAAVRPYRSPLRPSSTEEQPDSPPSQDSAYFSQSQHSPPSPPSSLPLISSSISPSTAPSASAPPSSPSAPSSLPSDCEDPLSSSQPRFITSIKNDESKLSPTEPRSNLAPFKASGLSRPRVSRSQTTRALGPARASGLKRKSSASKPGSNNENSPAVQTTISGLWKSFSFSRECPRLSRKQPLSPHKDNPLVS